MVHALDDMLVCVYSAGVGEQPNVLIPTVLDQFLVLLSLNIEKSYFFNFFVVCFPTIPSPPAQSQEGWRDGGTEGGEKLTLIFVFAHVDECWRVDQARFEVVDHAFFPSLS